jgi:hypothetical protein
VNFTQPYREFAFLNPVFGMEEHISTEPADLAAFGKLIAEDTESGPRYQGRGDQAGVTASPPNSGTNIREIYLTALHEQAPFRERE